MAKKLKHVLKATLVAFVIFLTTFTVVYFLGIFLAQETFDLGHYIAKIITRVVFFTTLVAVLVGVDFFSKPY